MRLAQLARKIALKPSDITAFLASKNIVVEESSNAKVADDHVRLVLEHYAPELLVEQVETEVEVGSEEVEEIISEAPLTAAESVEEPKQVPSEELPEEEKIIPEVIKPVKVELPGLKVVGKIDLPEPRKKKEEEQPEGSSQENPVANPEEVIPSAPKREFRKPRNHPREMDRRPRKNSVALQREREEREALRKKLEQKEKEKELKTQRYLKKVSQYTPPVKRARKKKEEEYEVLEYQKPKPKSLFGKILSWFISE